MYDIPENQIGDWLKKLQRESWQLELLVSGFTIFLLIQAIGAFDDYIIDLRYQYNSNNIVFGYFMLFIGLVGQSIQILAICLVAHLMLRGFWIGAIGLRSVQSAIDFSSLNYSEFFTQKLKKKVISLDQLVIRLDEICSVIFAFAFLVMSILMAFGMFLVLMGMMMLIFNTLAEVTPDWFDIVVTIIGSMVMITLMISGLIYLIDYFTLGFFKKIKWIAKIYYPFYRFYNVVTLAALSRSIYYYLISKFSKRKIRMVYAIVGSITIFYILIEFDQHQYFPEDNNEYFIMANYYDNLRAPDRHVDRISIASNYIDRPHFQVYLRYNAADNDLIKSHCNDFEPLKDDGLNWTLKAYVRDGNLNISSENFSDENFEKLLQCQSSIYQISINDSVYKDLKYYFYVHQSRNQKGLLVTIPTNAFSQGENLLEVKKIEIDTVGDPILNDFANVPFWYNPN